MPIVRESKSLTVETKDGNEVATMWVQNGKLQVLECCNSHYVAELSKSEVLNLINYLALSLDNLKD
ncbi:hypothetical protein NVP1188A_78 [Vibrio phage 1.188.A._10N.286.51.A6]|uniref:Coil containing protein n=3 Tax=Mukerjeevirus mv51A6 TaxID=2734162 RepID=A0A2I7RJ23_9CAUD|nr:hypothetical protein HOU77_gp28 [Vibrio phage 1.188.A._10N.286.51.A6]AUR93646.1 hypothetical protein NVP1188A_78 [Vibrio phage 1.188.A._10N.286.51.A6]AUR93732.1 hypothetical protein NVP1188B_78 [Vibrio phage 1.188.B._10N.286.51.A6]AUR93818.1 hypothetical protein NVP1188C_78 [Vibrio phage 1.188.C._10N.286.51.A6]